MPLLYNLFSSLWETKGLALTFSFNLSSVNSGWFLSSSGFIVSVKLWPSVVGLNGILCWTLCLASGFIGWVSDILNENKN